MIKNRILFKIPFFLLYSRLVVAFFMTIFSFIKISPTIIIALTIYAIISDIFDGIIARKLKISSQEMRRLDTKIDTIFWFSCLFYICLNHADFLKSHLLKIGILVFSELLITLFGFLKFHERISYHTILSKFWALLLLWFVVTLISKNSATLSFEIAFWYGIVVQLEILLIAIILKNNQTDIPNVCQAIKFKKGHKITKHYLFNG